MSKPRITIDNGYFFIIALLLFIFNSSLVTVFLARDFKNTTDLFSYFFAGAGALLTIKSFVTSYANITFSIRDQRYYAITANIILGVFQFVCVFLALLWLKEDSYPQITAAYFLAASIGLIAQIALGKLTSATPYQVIGIIYYALIFGLLYTRIFNADIRFLQIISATDIVLELVLLLNLYRTFQLQDVVKIRQIS